MQVINRSPAYRNQYVHRRDSVTIEQLELTENEIQQRERLGLIVDPPEEDEDAYEEDEEDWSDFEEAVEFDDDGNSSDEDHFTFSNRPSSVTPNMTIASPPGKNFWGDQEGEENFDTSSNFTRSVNVADRRGRYHTRFSAIAENAEDEDEMSD